MRKVTFEFYDYNQRKLVDGGFAVFHQFGLDWQEFDVGGCSYSTGILELPDGTMRNIPVGQIKFLEPIQGA